MTSQEQSAMPECLEWGHFQSNAALLCQVISRKATSRSHDVRRTHLGVPVCRRNAGVISMKFLIDICGKSGQDF